MTADDVSRVMLVLIAAMSDRGIRAEDRMAIYSEVEERLTELIDGSGAGLRPNPGGSRYGE